MDKTQHRIPFSPMSKRNRGYPSEDPAAIASELCLINLSNMFIASSSGTAGVCSRSTVDRLRNQRWAMRQRYSGKSSVARRPAPQG